MREADNVSGVETVKRLHADLPCLCRLKAAVCSRCRVCWTGQRPCFESSRLVP